MTSLSWREKTVNLAVAQVDSRGNVGPVTRGTVEVHDHSSPALSSVLAEKDASTIDLTFSKPIDATSAQEESRYSVKPELKISKITPSEDGRSVAISFAEPIPADTEYTLHVAGLKDRTPYANVLVPANERFNAQNIVYTLKAAKLPAESTQTPVTGLPLQKRDAWTMNLLVKPSKKPEDRTVIAGFGEDSDDGKGGTSRYFASFDDGIRFWSADRDVTSSSPLEVGRWQMLTITYDGRALTIYKDGDTIAQKDVDLNNDPVGNVNVGVSDPWEHERKFAGELQAFTIRRGALDQAAVKELFNKTKPTE